MEFKIKQIEGLTNENVKEFMTKWNNTKKPIFLVVRFSIKRVREALDVLQVQRKTKERTKTSSKWREWGDESFENYLMCRVV